jgi:PRTRC genetic system protein E
MFKELAPLLRHRSVLLTVTHLEEDQFRVNVVPKKIADSENDALTTPLSVTGTVDELDEQLPQTLQSFVCSHLELKNSLERAKDEMEAAAKAAQAEARAKSKPQVTKKDAQAKATVPTSAANEKPEPPKTTGLFDTPPEPIRTTAVTTASRASGTAANADEEEEILAEIAEREEESMEDDSAA